MVPEVVQIDDEFDEYYITTSSDRLDDRTRVLKHGDTFAVFDRFGDIEPFGPGELGIYHQDTRFLSRMVLRLENRRPLLLSSTIKDDSASMGVDLMNGDIRRSGQVVITRGTIHLLRSKVLWNSSCYERLRIHSYGDSVVHLTLAIDFDADFRDIFEVRGLERTQRGQLLPMEVTRDSLVFSYRGLDDRLRSTRIIFTPPPSKLEGSTAYFQIRLDPGDEVSYRWAITFESREDSKSLSPVGNLVPAGPHVPCHYEDALQKTSTEWMRLKAEEPVIRTSNEQFNDWLNRSRADLQMMRTETPHGPYPYAGVPWFSTVFGRDGIITALQTLWCNPSIARGVLAYLAATQANCENNEQDAQPGKILHETRGGEVAMLGEVPFRRYYGSVDSTPLFIVLAGAYFRRTGDRAFIETIWPNVERALDWIDHYGDSNGDGFVDYARKSSRGLVHQGWKDSHDSVFHDDGSPPKPPIALCEVQGYVYAAKMAAAELADELGFRERSQSLIQDAVILQRRFEDAFWCEDMSTYGIAIDGDGRLCRVRTSNAGHCLFSGIVSDRSRACRMAAALVSQSSFSGWGIRTLAVTEVHYNPMSYHNGSVWPHDNSLIAAGFARYGLKEEAESILTGLFDASLFFDIHRLPELFCGFPRRPGESPTLYPVSCSPQAWASGVVFLLLQACLGLEVQGVENQVVFSNPRLPPFLNEVRIHNLRVGAASLDLLLTRHQQDVGINILQRKGNVSVVVTK
ncbi:MAG TPA: amylo-alpha-1,6-glucosidase [Acidobacteriota bacterium]|nr:amylo-alpha-1,6-glucosidase [Acidobacteriota bacterium]